MNEKNKRSKRRFYNRLKKKKYAKILKSLRNVNSIEELNDKDIGIMASTHGATCSCPICGNPRKYFNEKTLQEKKIDITTQDDKNDYENQ